MFIVGFFFAEGVWTALGGKSVFRHKNKHKALYDNVAKNKKIYIDMDHHRDSNSHIYNSTSRRSGIGKKVLRAISSGRMPRD
jgi:hypothetical protein